MRTFFSTNIKSAFGQQDVNILSDRIFALNEINLKVLLQFFESFGQKFDVWKDAKKDFLFAFRFDRNLIEPFLSVPAITSRRICASIAQNKKRYCLMHKSIHWTSIGSNGRHWSRIHFGETSWQSVQHWRHLRRRKFSFFSFEFHSKDTIFLDFTFVTQSFASIINDDLGSWNKNALNRQNGDFIPYFIEFYRNNLVCWLIKQKENSSRENSLDNCQRNKKSKSQDQRWLIDIESKQLEKTHHLIINEDFFILIDRILMPSSTRKTWSCDRSCQTLQSILFSPQDKRKHENNSA